MHLSGKTSLSPLSTDVPDLLYKLDNYWDMLVRSISDVIEEQMVTLSATVLSSVLKFQDDTVYNGICVTQAIDSDPFQKLIENVSPMTAGFIIPA